ncbi:unnamed protein product [Periconia digitata]|uniref:2EXR domain-containing protein n=1 Tax=Periconia digitata TaxID=1303443 RepID=A0A9W4XQQ1_9PLEO|nr:unnamed protein product [Periconia digitata]
MTTHSDLQPPWDSTPGSQFSLNDSLMRPRAGTSFSLFQKLPPELRNRIWKFSLPQQRLLKVTVTAAEPSRVSTSKVPNLSLYQEKNRLGNVISGADYFLRLGSTDTNSPLLYVNNEANAVVQSDTILIYVKRDEDEVHFADFVHDALAYDRKKKGILHMAIMSKKYESKIRLPMDLSCLHSRAKAALASTLAGLDSVSLVHLYPTRTLHQGLSQVLLRGGKPDDRLVQFDEASPLKENLLRFYRAFPLWASTATYSMLQTDPRSASQYLELTDAAHDPRSLIRAWRMLETAYNIPPTSDTKIRIWLAMGEPDERQQISTLYQAFMFRQREEQTWMRLLARGNFYVPERDPDNDDALDFSEMLNAIGFWSIPAEAFGFVPEVDYAEHRWGRLGAWI